MPTKKENNYLHFLDGLRAVAILAVLAFHFDNTWLSGGFLGVEIFFVISGFIITKLLLAEWQKTGKIDLKRFGLRRFRRLIPAAFTVMLATWICVLLWFPEEINQVFEDLIYGLTFTNNWNYIVNERSYFELIGRPRLFEHLWSLGVEFQFYVFWALLCTVLFRLKKSMSISIIALSAFASTCLMATLFNPEIDPSRIYFGTDTRISALLIGSIVALLVRENDEPLNSTNHLLLNFVTFIGAVGLVSFCLFTTSSDAFLFQGGFLAVSILTASVIVSCLLMSKTTENVSPILWLLSSAPLRFIGIRAYGLYLWHWAIFALTQPFVDVPFEGLTLLFFRLGLTLMFSEITFQFIEKPIRNGSLERFFMQQKSFALWMFAGSMSLVGCSGLMIATEKKLETTPQYVINEAINEKAASLNEGALDVPLIERAKNDAICDVEENAQVISAENKLFLVADQTAKESKPVKLHDIKVRPAETKVQTTTPQNRLQFERAKGKGYVNRVTTVEKAGEKSPVFLLGDSVMVGATDELVKRLPNASLDSQVGRQLSKGIQILNERKANNTLSDTVIIHLGNNSPINQHQIDDLVSLLTEKRKLVFVNLKLPRNYESANNQLLDEAAKKHPNIRVIDWHSRSMNAENIFGKDGIHLLGNGAKLYADLIANALK
ncbi:MAG: acyltransferase family protein [Methylococcales bacterium]|nr:acyltransferase family protein [Methylococcales bacterium]